MERALWDFPLLWLPAEWRIPANLTGKRNFSSGSLAFFMELVYNKKDKGKYTI
jgi:hypothetical protein